VHHVSTTSPQWILLSKNFGAGTQPLSCLLDDVKKKLENREIKRTARRVKREKKKRKSGEYCVMVRSAIPEKQIRLIGLRDPAVELFVGFRDFQLVA
jgi:hypothetical protein